MINKIHFKPSNMHIQNKIPEDHPKADQTNDHKMTKKNRKNKNHLVSFSIVRQVELLQSHACGN